MNEDRKPRSRPTHRVVLRRSNGRIVRDYPAWSRYGAKQLRNWLERKHDPGYWVDIQRWPVGDPRTYTDGEKRQFCSLYLTDIL